MKNFWEYMQIMIFKWEIQIWPNALVKKVAMQYTKI